MSVTPKCESRTCRNASARNQAATSAVALPNRCPAMRKSTQTETTPAVALSTRAARKTGEASVTRVRMKCGSPLNQPNSTPNLKNGTRLAAVTYMNSAGQSKKPGLKFRPNTPIATATTASHRAGIAGSAGRTLSPSSGRRPRWRESPRAARASSASAHQNHVCPLAWPSNPLEALKNQCAGALQRRIVSRRSRRAPGAGCRVQSRSPYTARTLPPIVATYCCPPTS